LDPSERKAQRRAQLLESGLELFAENGYPNTSIEQLCSRAYVGTKAFYELFANKEDCYIALLREVSERIQRQVAEALRHASGSEERIIESLVDAFAHALVDDPRVARVSFGTAAGISPAVERQRRENRRWAASFVAGVWRQFDGGERGVDYRPMAVGLVGGMFELIAGWLLDVDEEPTPDETVRLIADLTAFAHAVRRGLR
jgi:AcrR family transcriptional regulator